MKQPLIYFPLAIAIVLFWTVGYLIGSYQPQGIRIYPAPTLEELNQAIKAGQGYYESLYRDLGEYALIVKYRSNPKFTYTIRHGAIGGYHYFNRIGETEKSDKLKAFINSVGLDAYRDPHALMWRSFEPNGGFFDIYSYDDCYRELPDFQNIYAYTSKVCRVGESGRSLFLYLISFDPFSKLIDILIDPNLDTKEVTDLYFNTGNGIPMCTPFWCSSNASAYRTAIFGEVKLRAGNKLVAGSVARNLLDVQGEDGEFFINYTRDNELITGLPWYYKVINLILGDRPIYNGLIPTNAETMNDVLAFLLNYRCDVYGVCN